MKEAQRLVKLNSFESFHITSLGFVGGFCIMCVNMHISFVDNSIAEYAWHGFRMRYFVFFVMQVHCLILYMQSGFYEFILTIHLHKLWCLETRINIVEQFHARVNNWLKLGIKWVDWLTGHLKGPIPWNGRGFC